MRSFKSNENIHKKEGGPHHAASANKAPPATPQPPGNESQRKHCNPANLKRQPTQRPAQTKTGSKQIKTRPEYEPKPITYFWFLRILSLISKDQNKI